MSGRDFWSSPGLAGKQFIPVTFQSCLVWLKNCHLHFIFLMQDNLTFLHHFY